MRMLLVLRPTCRRLFALVLLSLPVHLAAAADTDELAAVLWRYNDLADVDSGPLAHPPLPIPSTEQLADLAGGDMVHVREHLASHDPGEPHIRVVGYQVVERPRLLVWLATLYSETRHDSRLLEHRINTNGTGGSTWYQHMNTPWPVRNRHWVIRTEKNTALAEATQDLVWEHHWALAEDGRDLALNLLIDNTLDGLDEADYERTIYLNENSGAWTMFEVDENTTLVVAHTVADMGGWIPDRWVASVVRRQLGGVLRSLGAKADRIHEIYSPERPVFDGRGQRITAERVATLRARIKAVRERTAGAAAPAAGTRE